MTSHEQVAADYDLEGCRTFLQKYSVNIELMQKEDEARANLLKEYRRFLEYHKRQQDDLDIEQCEKLITQLNSRTSKKDNNFYNLYQEFKKRAKMLELEAELVKPTFALLHVIQDYEQIERVECLSTYSTKEEADAALKIIQDGICKPFNCPIEALGINHFVVPIPRLQPAEPVV